MIDLSTYHEGFVAGFVPGLVLGLGLMKMAWEHSERRRRSAALKVPVKVRLEAADVVRYLRWRDEQTMRALTDPDLGTPWDKPRD